VRIFSGLRLFFIQYHEKSIAYSDSVYKSLKPKEYAFSKNPFTIIFSKKIFIIKPFLFVATN